MMRSTRSAKVSSTQVFFGGEEGSYGDREVTGPLRPPSIMLSRVARPSKAMSLKRAKSAGVLSVQHSYGFAGFSARVFQSITCDGLDLGERWHCACCVRISTWRHWWSSSFSKKTAVDGTPGEYNGLVGFFRLSDAHSGPGYHSILGRSGNGGQKLGG